MEPYNSFTCFLAVSLFFIDIGAIDYEDHKKDELRNKDFL